VVHADEASPFWEEEVVFGITGTADTTQLERAIQSAQTRTIHAVHGQATGPNFFGISDMAYFRTGYDAKAYRKLKSYGECVAVTSPMKEPALGERGALIMTNLSHPMNPEYASLGVQRDVSVLRAIAAAIARFDGFSGPKKWRPHPIIGQLPDSHQRVLRSVAQDCGFIEVNSADPMLNQAREARWVFTTPSTVASEALAEGILCVIIDPACMLTDEALSMLPKADTDPDTILPPLSRLGNHQSMLQEFTEVFSAVEPAKKFDMRQSRFGGF